MIDLLWDYGEISAIVLLLVCVWLWKTRKDHKALGKDDEHSEVEKSGEFR